MKIAILGYAEQGKSAYEYYSKTGNDIIICDMNPNLDLPTGSKSHLGDQYLKGLNEFDLLLRTPIIHPDQIKQANSSTPNILDKVTTVTNEFMKICPTKNTFGITGTKGKGTTSSLIAKILESYGYRVHLGGNIGTPPFVMLEAGIKVDDWVVLELANFQLIDLKHSPHIGVCLMVVPEHLNWHKDFDEYVTAKQQMFRWQTSNDIAIYYSLNPVSKKIASVGDAMQIPYFSLPGAIVEDNKIKIDGQTIVEVAEIKLLGRHNLQNVCAAVTACWQVKKDPEVIKSVLTTFKGLQHRLEFVRELNGVAYYDDSFGTTPETAIVAIEAFSKPKLLILGGSDKQSDYLELARVVKDSDVRKVLLIGETAPLIKEALDKVGYSNYMAGGNNMNEIVSNLQKQSQAGDIALLSTACASFDMFANYQERGDQFKQAVRELV